MRGGYGGRPGSAAAAAWDGPGLQSKAREERAPLKKALKRCRGLWQTRQHE